MPRTLGQALAFIAGFWLALTLWPLTVQVARAEADAPYAELEAHFHEQVNQERGRRHLIPLERSTALDRVARAHSADMARRGFFSHVNPEGLNPLDRLQAAGVGGFTLAAENAGLTDRSEPNREILQGWIASPVHRGNLHGPPFNRTGIGIARAPDGTYYFTQLYVTVPR